MATCDTIEVDLTPVNYDVTICNPTAFDVKILQPDVTIEALSVGNAGPPGQAATIAVGTTTTSVPGGLAHVSNSGTSQNAVFDFTIPTGSQGPPGTAGTQGPGATVTVGTTTTLVPGSSASVTNSGTLTDSILNFGIPRGDVGSTGATGSAGAAATIAVGTTTTGAPGSLANVTNTGSSSAAVFNFTVPQGPVGATGAQGPQGSTGATGSMGAPGTAATLTAGTTTTGAPGSAANVTNSGSSSAAIFNFTIPRGDVGATGSTGPQGPQGVPGEVPAARIVSTQFSLTGGGDLSTNRTLSLVGDSASPPRGRYYGTNGSGALGYQDLSAGVTPTIWSARLRSYNAVGNPNFEIDQRNCGTVLSNPPGATFLCDRWTLSKTGTIGVNTQRQVTSNVVAPGTNFRLSANILLIQLQTQQTTLAAGDFLFVVQNVEGPRWRELAGDVHSISLLVNSTVAPLKFSIVLRDPPTTTKSLVKLCTIPTANTWTLIPLPNLPVWPAGSFSTVPGAAGYQLGVTLAAGSNFMSPAADVWQSGGFIGAPGMDNWAALPVGTNFYLGFVQHEPGSQCTTFMDLPWQVNYDDCLRYYSKSYDYATLPGTVTSAGAKGLFAASGWSNAFGTTSYPKPMAKVPTTTCYNYATGAAGSVRDSNGTDHASAVAANLGQTGFAGLGFTTATTAMCVVYLNYTADTAW